MKILVVEDDFNFGNLLQVELQDVGHVVTPERDGVEAVLAQLQLK